MRKIRLCKAAQLLMAILTIVSVLTVSACSNKTENGINSEGDAQQGAEQALTFWIPMNSNATSVVKTMNDIAMVQEWEKKTNVNFEFQHPTGTSSADVTQQFGVLMASGKLPDVMFWSWNGVSGGTSKMHKDGMIIKLNDLIDQQAPNLKKILDEHPEIAKQIMDDNGDIFVMPSLRFGEYGKYRTFAGQMIRQDWLDELGLKQPVTIDDWENVLKTIKEKKGIVPYTAQKDLLIAGASSHDFAGAFNIGSNFYVDGGKVKYGPLEPAFKDYLARMQSWYQQGLIDPDYAISDSKAMDAKISSGKAAAFFGYIGASIGTLTPALQQTDPDAKIAAVQYPVAKQGDTPKFMPYNWDYPGQGAVITTANDQPEKTIRALDYLYSEEGARLKNFGIEGETYTLVNGKPVYTDLILKNQDGLPVGQAMAKYFIANYSFVGTDDDRYNDQYYVLPEQKEAAKLYSKYASNATEVVMPPISMTVDEASEFGKIMTDINTYRNEMITKIIMGAQPVDSFDEVLKQMKNMGIERAIEIQQAALDRYAARK